MLSKLAPQPAARSAAAGGQGAARPLGELVISNNKMRIRARLVVRLQLIKDAEWNPELWLWPTQALARGYVKVPLDTVVRLDNNTVEATVQLDHTWTMRPRVAADVLSRGMLHVLHMNQHLAKNGTAIRYMVADVPQGVPLVDFMADRKDRNYALVSPGAGAVKGSLSVFEPAVGYNDEHVMLRQELANKIDDYKAQLLAPNQLLLRYMEQCRQFCASVPLTYQCLAGVQAHQFVTMAGDRLPIAAYVSLRSPEATLAYYSNLLDIALRRERIVRADFAAGRCSDEQEVAVLATVLTIFANQTVYEADHTLLPGTKARYQVIEQFCHFLRELRSAGVDLPAGDCEDDGLEIYYHTLELRDLPDAASDPALLRLQRVRHCFYAQLLLAGVESGDIGGDFKVLERIGAHLHCAIVPKALFATIYGDKTPLPQLAELGDSPEALERSRRLWIVPLEGTGYLSPHGTGEPPGLKAARDHLAALDTDKAAFGHLGRYYFWDRVTQQRWHFYMLVAYVWTGELLERGLNVCAFAPTPPPPAPPTRGITYQQFVAGTWRVLAEPELTREVRVAIAARQAELLPVHRLRAPAEDADEPQPTEVLTAIGVAAELDRRLQILLREQGPGQAGEHTVEYVLFVPYVMMTRRRAAAIVDVLSRSEMLRAFSYDHEVVTHGIGKFRLTLTLARVDEGGSKPSAATPPAVVPKQPAAPASAEKPTKPAPKLPAPKLKAAAAKPAASPQAAPAAAGIAAAPGRPAWFY